MPLLKTLAELKDFVRVDVSLGNVATSFIPPSIVLSLADVEDQVLAPLLGPDLLAWLQGQYDAPGFVRTGTSVAAKLLRLVQAALARLGLGVGLTGHQVTVDATGVHIVVSDKIKTAFSWQVDRLQAQLEQQGLRDVDALQQWLEDNLDLTPELQAWADSPAGQAHRRELFTSTADFQEYEHISSSRAVFQALGPVRRRLERLELGRVLGLGFLQELREQVRTRALSSENDNLLRSYVYPALASLTIGYGINELALRLNGDGIDLMVQRVDDSNAKEADAGLDRLLQNKADTALLSAGRFLTQLTSYLDYTASPTRFATYYASPAYTAPAPPPVRNTPDSKVYKFY